MPVELKIAALGAVLLLVHILAAGNARTKQYGRHWNVGARDEAQPPLNPVAGRLARAQANFQETFPIAVVALLGVVIVGQTSPVTASIRRSICSINTGSTCSSTRAGAAIAAVRTLGGR